MGSKSCVGHDTKDIKKALKSYPDHPEMLVDLKRIKAAIGVTLSRQ